MVLVKHVPRAQIGRCGDFSSKVRTSAANASAPMTRGSGCQPARSPRSSTNAGRPEPPQQSLISRRQMSTVACSSPASSGTPQRRSMRSIWQPRLCRRALTTGMI